MSKIDDLGDPEEIRKFLGTILNDFRLCTISNIVADLHKAFVITGGQQTILNQKSNDNPGDLLYGYLTADPSNKKLRELARILQQDKTYHQNCALGAKIEDFLDNPKDFLLKMAKMEQDASLVQKAKFVPESSSHTLPGRKGSTTDGTTRDLKIKESPMEVALEKSLGQRSVHLNCLLEWNKAVCRIRTELKNLKGEALGSSAGTCFFVKVKDKIYCITCCHCVLGVEGWTEVAKAAERLKDMPKRADKLIKGDLLNALYSDAATIKHPEEPPFSLEKARACPLKDLFNNSENSLTIAEPELLAIECTNIPETVKPLEIDSEVTRKALEKLSCSEGAQSVLGIVHIPEEEPHSGHVEFSHGRLTDKEDDFLTYYIDTFYGSSGSPVFLFDANLKDGHDRRVAEVGQGVVVGVHRQGDNKGMIFQNILNKLI